MGRFICSNPDCLKEFKSKHSVAKYCSKDCFLVSRGKQVLTSYPRSKKYSDEQLVKVLQKEAAILGRTPSKKHVKTTAGLPSATTFESRFGSWANACAAAGLLRNRAHPEKFTNSQRNVSPSTRFRVLMRDGFKCVYCGGTPKDGYTLQVDHVIPVSKGGTTTENNLVTACWLCNSGKSNIELPANGPVV